MPGLLLVALAAGEPVGWSVLQWFHVRSVAVPIVRIPPNLLGGNPTTVDRILEVIVPDRCADSIELDLASVSWVCPYGAALLLSYCRAQAMETGCPVQLRHLQPAIHAYLERIDFFAFDVAVHDESLAPAARLSRSPASSNVVEMYRIRMHRDVYDVTGRARRVLEAWFQAAPGAIDSIVSLLSEACANIVDHSDDWGIVTVQKYERGAYADVELAISDLGQGIRQSLLNRYPHLHESASGFLKRALEGLSARAGSRGGQGLGAMQRIATGSGGLLHIRSGTASVLARQGTILPHEGLPAFPGTHVAIRFRSPRT